MVSFCFFCGRAQQQQGCGEWGAMGTQAGRSRSPGPTFLRSPLLRVFSCFSACDCFSLFSSSFLPPGFSQPLQLTARHLSFPSRAVELLCASRKPTTQAPFAAAAGPKALLASLSGRINVSNASNCFSWASSTGVG